MAVRDAFALFEEPRNLERITPPWLGFRITTPGRIAMRKGAEIDYRMRWMNFAISWKTLISEYEPPFRFVDEQVQGPYRFWRHTHEFHPTEEGTVITDTVEYALPLGVLGRLAHRFVVAEQLRQIFQFRQDALREMMGGQLASLMDPMITGK